MSRTSLAVLILSTLVVAGCVSPGAGTDTADAANTENAFRADWAAHALTYGDDHDHTDPKQHADMTTPNFELVGWNGLGTDYHGKTSGGYLCGEGATTEEGRRLAVVSSFTTGIAFVVADVTDPANPVKVGEYALEGVKTYDVAVTPDGRHVAIAADSLGNNEDPRTATLNAAGLNPVRLTFRDACTGETRNAGPEQMLPLEPGVVLVGIRDPKNPTFEDFAPTPVLGPHSVSTAIIDGHSYVTASITNLVHSASYFNFYEVMETPVGGKLALLSTIDAQQYGALQTGFAALGNGHVEAALAKHPGTGKTVAYLCDWDDGLITLDMSNPQAPTLLGTWQDTQVEGGAFHSAFPLPDMREGKHYVIGGQEFLHRPEDRSSGWIYILDDTDPSDIKEVARWTLPVDTEPDWGNNELFSTHYFAVQNDTLFVTFYHGGVWAVDITDPATPRSVGVFMPANEPESAPNVRWQGQIRSWPYVLDVIPNPDGTLTTWDSTSGVYLVRFDPALQPPSVMEWPMVGAKHDDGM